MASSPFHIDLAREAPAFAQACDTLLHHIEEYNNTQQQLLRSLVILGAWLLLPVCLSLLMSPGIAGALCVLQVLVAAVLIRYGTYEAAMNWKHTDRGVTKLVTKLALVLMGIIGGAIVLCVVAGLFRRRRELKAARGLMKDPRVSFILFGEALKLYNELGVLCHSDEARVAELVEQGRGDQYAHVLHTHLRARENMLARLQEMFYLRPLGRPWEKEALQRITDDASMTVKEFERTLLALIKERKHLVATYAP
ncbi:hypothetical protein HY631_04275 [Candidatus Uhrbacteria bacterium]|nr:hypothetical protein [Candidatus Uhrbacteria bacterium]